MKKLRIELLVVAALPLAGCIPMEQASLVYASKADIGIGVVAGTPENPGLEVNIGYKASDVAFVPVAVAKHCAAPANCSAINYNVLQLNGRNNVAGNSAADREAIKTLTDDIESRSALIDGQKKRISDLSTQMAVIDRLPANTARLAALTANDPATNAPRALTADEQTEKGEVEKEIAIATALGTKAKLKAESDGLVASNRNLEKENEDARDTLKIKYGVTDTQNSDVKEDAYSVYGTFGGNSSGTSSGAALTGNKLFSTGIASQNLTQGIREASRADAMARCLDATAKILASDAMKGDDHAKERERIATLCSLTVRVAD